MRNGYSDKTSETAVGNIDKEWKNMARLALQMRNGRNNNPLWIEDQEKKFTGIFKRLLTDSIEELQHIAGR